ncbi:B12-binding domain-containing radical SAM protein [Myxococcota bacterium]|nr:B12-binding domain-containing radical SAM protein [Myxococcota bacterium]
MKALFLIPPAAFNARGLPIDRVYGCNYGFDYKPAIHFLQVATFAQVELGWQVRFLDCPAEGVDEAAFDALIAAEQWDVVLHWSTYLSAVEDLEAARRIHARRPGTRFVFMGTAPTWKPEEFRVGDQSWCLLGEPEHTLRELDEAWRGQRRLEGIDGLAWFPPGGGVQRGAFRQLLDVTTLPMPDRGLLLGRYRANRLDVHPITTMAVSRGCGFRCTFCCTNAVDQAIELEFKRLQPTYVQRPPLRKRTVEQIVAEFQDIAARGYKGVEIADNIFTWGKKRTTAICEGIEPLGLHWICLARANMLHDAEQIRAMARAGCKMVYMGSETFDDGLLEDCVKEIHVRDVVQAVETCRANGVEPEISVLIGASPNETWSTVYNSWRMSRRLGTRFVHFSVALPSPSTEMYDQAMHNGWFVEGDFRPADNAREVIINLPHLSRAELALALKLAYAAQYLSPAGIWKQVSAVRSGEDLLHKARSATRLLGFLAERTAQASSSIPPGRVTPPSA